MERDRDMERDMERGEVSVTGGSRGWTVRDVREVLVPFRGWRVVSSGLGFDDTGTGSKT